MRALLLIVVTLLVTGPQPLLGQNSIFGVHGIGFPGRSLSARARALGGGAGMFDARSALNPASVAALGNLVVTASSGTSLRNVSALDSVADGLSETRFPYALMGTRVRYTPLSVALSYSSYAERTYDQATVDSVTIRGERIQVIDRIASSGAVADIRAAVGWRVLPRLNIGGAIHIMSGSVQKLARRTFVDTDDYYGMNQENKVRLSGLGVSAGVTFAPIPEVGVAASYRSDSELKSMISDVDAGTVDLPVSYSGGLFLQPHPSIRLATSVERKLWSSAGADLEAVGGANAFDTWTVGSGLELGGGSGVPLRVGVRYSQLPFSPSDEQARELGYSAGTAMRFARGRATLEASVERILRDGAGAEERAWYFMFALTVMP